MHAHASKQIVGVGLFPLTQRAGVWRGETETDGCTTRDSIFASLVGSVTARANERPDLTLDEEHGSHVLSGSGSIQVVTRFARIMRRWQADLSFLWWVAQLLRKFSQDINVELVARFRINQGSGKSRANS